jgi:hypothetical protein
VPFDTNRRTLNMFIIQESPLLSYLITPWSRVLLEKLTGFQLVKKFPAFYGTRRFITAFKFARHLSLSSARLIQSMPPIPLPEDPSYYYPPTYAWVFQMASFSQVSPPKACVLLPPCERNIKLVCTISAPVYRHLKETENTS